MPRATQDLRALRLRGRDRGGVVSADDLRECGFSAAVVRRRVADGTWQRWGEAIVLWPGADECHGPEIRLGDLGLAWALQWTYGPHALISGALAMRRAGWQLPGESRIVVIASKPRIGVPGTVVLRRRSAQAIRRPDGLGYVPPMDALLDTLVSLSRPRSADLLDAALQRRVMSPEAFAAAVADRLGRGCRGASTLRALLARAQTGSRSEAEQRMGDLLARGRSGPWTANLPVRDGRGRVLAEIDFAHEGMLIAIEVDGRAHHSDRHAFERDRVRQNLLVVRGWLVLRFTWEQITQRPGQVLAAIDAAVARRSAERVLRS